MSDDLDDLELSEDDLDDDELAQLRRGSLFDDVATRWDPERILRLVSRRAGAGKKLDLATREKFERRLGVDLGHVKVYTGEFAEEVTRAHSAEAVTIGTTGMILMSGTPDRSPATSEGEALLAHELTHVAQGERGVYRRSSFDDPSMGHEEAEAEAEAEEAQELAGGEPAEDQDLAAQAQDREALSQEVLRKVLEMFADGGRVSLIRGGDRRFRP